MDNGEAVSVRTNRRGDILDAAARMFAERGYAAASMRDIAEEAKIRSASLYYHFPSKADLLLAVHQESAQVMCLNVREAIKGKREPWSRLEAACVENLKSLLESTDFIQVVWSEVPRELDEEMRRKIVHERDRYEAIFRELIAELPLRRSVSRKYVVLTLLGSMAWARRWYRPGPDRPEDVARAMVEIIRGGCEPR